MYTKRLTVNVFFFLVVNGQCISIFYFCGHSITAGLHENIYKKRAQPSHSAGPIAAFVR